VYFENMILARNRLAPWGWSKKIETCWSNFKCFNVKKFYVCALVGVLVKWFYMIVNANLCINFCSFSINVWQNKSSINKNNRLTQSSQILYAICMLAFRYFDVRYLLVASKVGLQGAPVQFMRWCSACTRFGSAEPLDRNNQTHSATLPSLL
jgi:hypothetical protein